MYISNQLPIYGNIFNSYKKKQAQPIFMAGGKPNIKYATFDSQMQDTMIAIGTRLKNIKKFFDNSSYATITKAKQAYKDLIPAKKLKGYTFMINEGEDKGKTISIVHNWKDKDITRLVLTDSMNNQEHILIDGIDKVVANVYQSNPYILPANLKYMTAQELSDNKIKERIDIAHNKLKEFDEYLSNLKVDKDDVIIETERKQSQKAYTPRKKLLEFFEMDKETLPKHIQIKHLSSKGQILSFTLATSDGGQLEVSKRANYLKNFNYVLMEKTSSSGEKTFLAVEPETRKFLKTNNLTGKPTLFCGDLTFYSTQEAKDLGLNDRFGQYITEIFGTDLKETTEQSSKRRGRKPKVDNEVVVSEPKRRGRKPKVKSEFQSEVKTVVQSDAVPEGGTVNKSLGVQKIGESPIEKVNPILIIENDVPKVNAEVAEKVATEKVKQPAEEGKKSISILDTIPNITELENEVKEKAQKDADYLSDLYINTLISKFAENMQMKLSSAIDKFIEKVSDTLKL